MITKTQKTVLTSFILMVIAAIFSSDSYVPSLPAIAISLKTSHELVRFTLTVYLLGLAFSPLLLGPVSDKYGRRPILLGGLMVACFGAIFCAFAPTIHYLIIGRFIQASGISSGMGVGRAMFADTFSGKERARISSYIGMLISLVPAIAPTVGGYLQSLFGWRSNFIFILLVFIAIIIFLYRLLPETHQVRKQNALHPKQLLKDYAQALTHRQFMIYALCSGLCFSGVMGYMAITPFLYQTVLGLSPVAYGWLGLLTGAAVFIGSLANSRLVHIFESDYIIYVGIACMLFSSLLMGVFGIFSVLNIWVVIIPFLIYTIGSQMLFSNCYSNSMDYMQTMLGLTAAVFAFVQMSCTSLGSMVVAFIHVSNQTPLAAFLLALAALCTLLMAALGKKPTNL